MSTSARNKRCSVWRGGQDVDARKEQAMQQVARLVGRRRLKGTSDAASGGTGKMTSERNKRYSQWRGRQDVDA
jgi:hypothetical protein